MWNLPQSKFNFTSSEKNQVVIFVRNWICSADVKKGKVGFLIPWPLTELVWEFGNMPQIWFEPKRVVALKAAPEFWVTLSVGLSGRAESKEGGGNNLLWHSSSESEMAARMSTATSKQTLTEHQFWLRFLPGIHSWPEVSGARMTSIATAIKILVNQLTQEVGKYC